MAKIPLLSFEKDILLSQAKIFEASLQPFGEKLNCEIFKLNPFGVLPYYNQ